MCQYTLMVGEVIVKTVGKMPFTGKHAIRRFYAEGSRAARHGSAEGRDFYVNQIGHYATINTLMGVTGFAMSGIIGFGVADETWQFIPDVLVTAAYGVGHSASALAQRIIRGRLHEQSINPNMNSDYYMAVYPQGPPTLWERIVTNGGTALMIAPVVHLVAYEALRR